MSTNALEVLERAIAAQREELRAYERPSEVLALETVRSIDHVFCRELFPEPSDSGDLDAKESQIMSWGVNHALRRILPENLKDETFRLYPSTPQRRVQADNFVFSCGVLALAERQAGLLREGLLSGTVEAVTDPRFRKFNQNILTLSAADPSLYSEMIGRRGSRWFSEQTLAADREREAALERRHMALLPELDRCVALDMGVFMDYRPTPILNTYFREWAELYLRRMAYRDLIGQDEVIGGRPFGDYVEVLSALSARAQTQLCFAGLIKDRHPSLTFRNLLTSFAPLDVLLRNIAGRLDADTLEVQRLLSHLTLEPDRKPLHLDRGTTAWAPVIQTSLSSCLLPVYGLDINPFLFLLNDLRGRYEKDWFRIANNREARWIAELERLFPRERWLTNSSNLKLRDGKDIVTDIDFAAYDTQTGQLAVFQLKWQQPIGEDSRSRRSTGKNLISESNRWIQAVRQWLEKFGAGELARRLELPDIPAPKIRLFVVARYTAHFSGYGNQDPAAAWADWSHFQKARYANPSASVFELATAVVSEISAARSEIELESIAIPLPNLAIAVNPRRLA